MHSELMPKTAWYNLLPHFRRHEFTPVYSLSKTARRALRGKSPAFCQLAGDYCTRLECQKNQFQRGCLGCKSPYHLCHCCRKDLICDNNIELCLSCLRKILRSKQLDGRVPLLKIYRVYCPLTHQFIKITTCLVRQTKKRSRCSNCDSPIRFCQQCRTTPIRYPEYGLCLKCTLKKFQIEL